MIWLRYKWFLVVILLALSFMGLVYFKIFLDHSSSSLKQSVEALKIRLLKEDKFLYRVHKMTKACSSFRPSNHGIEEEYEVLSQQPRRLRNIIVDDDHKLLYCYIPKVACTNWKKILYLLKSKNLTSLKQIPGDSVHREHVFLKLSDLEGEDIVRRLKTYNKFIFVRHPIERLVSAFRNKFVMNYTSSAYFKKRFGVTILKKFHRNEKISPKGDGVKFSEFVEYMVQTFDKNPKLLNEHWAPYTQLCHPCSIRYNLIGKYETLKQDADFILEEINAPEGLSFPAVIPSKTPVLVNSYVSSLTEHQYRGLMRMYNNDFEIFDYHYRRK